MKETISVIVPVYKVEKFLPCCIESILKQTYNEIEVILVDDGSPDSCGEICDEWSTKDSRVKVIHKENGGLSDARNKGLSFASGEYIAFIDSDDFIDNKYLQILYETIKNTGADIAECGVSFVQENGNKIRERAISDDILVLDKLEAHRRLILEDGIYQTVWNKLYKREIIGTISFPVGKCNEDDFWTYQVIDRVQKYVVINNLMYYYRQRGTSIMGMGYSIKMLDSLEARFQRMKFLQKYDELAYISAAHFQYDCLYHMQCILKYLKNDEKCAAQNFVLDKLYETPVVSGNKSGLSRKYQLWFLLFRKYPFFIANLRNRIGIGL